MMRNKIVKARVIGTLFGVIPVVLTLIPYTLTWWYIKENLFELNPVQNLYWAVYFILLYIIIWRAINYLSLIYINKRATEYS